MTAPWGKEFNKSQLVLSNEILEVGLRSDNNIVAGSDAAKQQCEHRDHEDLSHRD